MGLPRPCLWSLRRFSVGGRPQLHLAGSAVDGVRSHAGAFGLFAGTSPKKAPEVAELLIGEFHKLAEQGVTADELARARGQLAGGSALALEDTDTRMSRLGKSEISSGEFVDYDAALELLDAVTVERVQELAKELAAGKLSVVSVGQADDTALSRILAQG